MFRTAITTIVTMVLASAALHAEDFYPLKQGSQWLYALSSGAKMIISVTGQEEVKGVKCAVMQSEMPGITAKEYVAADSNGVNVYKAKGVQGEIEYGKPMVRIKLPLAEGDKWESVIPIGKQSLTTRMEYAGKETIKVPAGTFECIKIKSTGFVGETQVSVNTTWYSDGIGMVQMAMNIRGQEVAAQLLKTNLIKSAVETAASEPASRTATQATQTAGPAAEIMLLKHISLMDRNSGKPAFLMVIPADWKAGAEIVYRLNRPAAPADIAIRACSGDGNLEFNLIPALGSIWGEDLQRYGFREYLGAPVMRCPEDAREFLLKMALPRLRPELRNSEVRVLDARIDKERSKALTAEAQQVSPSFFYQVASILVEYRDPQTHELMQEMFTGTLLRMAAIDATRPSFHSWMMDNAMSFRAPAKELPKYSDLFACMAASLHPDKEWIADYMEASRIGFKGIADRQAAMMKQWEIMNKSYQDTAQVISDVNANRAKSQERSNQRWSEYIRGTQRYEAPDGKSTVELPNGYNHVWANGNGNYVLTNDSSLNKSNYPGVWKQLNKVN